MYTDIIKQYGESTLLRYVHRNKKLEVLLLDYSNDIDKVCYAVAIIINGTVYRTYNFQDMQTAFNAYDGFVTIDMLARKKIY